VPILDWKILARILGHVRQRIAIDIYGYRAWDAEDSRSFAKAIHGHPTITSCQVGRNFSHESLYSELATLPALESVKLCRRQIRPEDEITLARPESLSELLRVPSLRSVRFDKFDFTPALFRSMASALMEGTAVAKLEFRDCSFPAVECNDRMTNGLSRNTMVISIIAYECKNARALFDALPAALSSNSTLTHLELGRQDYVGGPVSLSPIFSALGHNTGLKSQKVGVCDSTEESMCTAINDGLRMNETLKSLEISYAPPVR
jgi:hypothetical protein